MILVDTNVLSELMRAKPAAAVMDWFARQTTSDLFLTAITEAELRTGTATMPAGQRRDRLSIAIDAMLVQDFAGRVLPFDSQAARSYAVIAADRRAAGRPIAEADCQIAAIARAREAVVAMRNSGDFEGCGIALVNPWDAA